VRKLLFALALSMPVMAQAKIIKIDITGNLYQVSSSVASRFSLGDTVTAQLVLDTDAPGSVFYPDTHLFADAVIGGFISVDGYTATFSNTARAFVTDDEFSGAMDRFLIDDYNSTAADVNGMPFHDLFLNWQDDTATASPGFTLPADQAGLAAYGLPRGGIDWLTSDGENRITFKADQVTVKSVPEPATWSMMIGGMAVVGWSVRRRRTSVRFA